MTAAAYRKAPIEAMPAGPGESVGIALVDQGYTGKKPAQAARRHGRE